MDRWLPLRVAGRNPRVNFESDMLLQLLVVVDFMCLKLSMAFERTGG